MDAHDIRVFELTEFISHPGFKYIEHFLDELTKIEQGRMDKIAKRGLNGARVNMYNFHLARKSSFETLRNSLKERMIEFMKDKDFQFTQSKGVHNTLDFKE